MAEQRQNAVEQKPGSRGAEVAGPREAQRLLHEMVRIRRFEERVRSAYLEGLVHGTTHLGVGQEAVYVGVAAALRADDYVTYTYRGHGICLARGMPMRAAFAEIFGRQTGTARGLGGSMHLTDPESGLIGSAGIVGGGLPIAVGAGLSAQMQGKGQLSVAFFGDGAANIGAFHESLNLASVWKLPVIFVCENNLYGEFTRIDRTTPFEELVRRADAYDMESMAIDGNDVDAVLAAARQAAELARSNGGPSFIECRTYRHHGHSRTDPAKYRPPEEVEYWMKRDPIKQYEQLLRDQDLMSDVERNDLYEGVEREVMQASTAAANDAWPEPGSYFSHVLAP